MSTPGTTVCFFAKKYEIWTEFWPLFSLVGWIIVYIMWLKKIFTQPSSPIRNYTNQKACESSNKTSLQQLQQQRQYQNNNVQITAHPSFILKQFLVCLPSVIRWQLHTLIPEYMFCKVHKCSFQVSRILWSSWNHPGFCKFSAFQEAWYSKQ